MTLEYGISVNTIFVIENPVGVHRHYCNTLIEHMFVKMRSLHFMFLNHDRTAPLLISEWCMFLILTVFDLWGYNFLNDEVPWTVAYLDYTRQKRFTTTYSWACLPLIEMITSLIQNRTDSEISEDNGLQWWYIDILT